MRARDYYACSPGRTLAILGALCMQICTNPSNFRPASQRAAMCASSSLRPAIMHANLDTPEHPSHYITHSAMSSIGRSGGMMMASTGLLR
eukprot:scaffold5723_cov18-Tisochrysis_lutea.AAC.1